MITIRAGSLDYEVNNENDKLCIVILDMYSHLSGNEIMDFHKKSLEPMKDWVKFYSFNVKGFSDIAQSPLSILKDLEEISTTIQL